MSDSTDTKPADDDAVDPKLNAIGAAGQSADPFVGRPVSGMPIGGPHNLGKEAHERAEDEEENEDGDQAADRSE